MSEIEDRRKEFEELAPWFVAGLLSPEEMARFETALAGDPVLRANVEAARAELDATLAANEDAGAPPARTWDRIAAAVAEQPRKAGLFDRARDLCGRLVQRASLAPVGAAAAAAAAALVITVESGTLVYMAKNDASSAYHVASDAGSRDRGPEALVAFAPDITVARVTEILSTRGAAIVDGPRAGGYFRVALGADLRTPADVAQALAALRAEKGVVAVLAAPSR